MKIYLVEKIEYQSEGGTNSYIAIAKNEADALQLWYEYDGKIEQDRIDNPEYDDFTIKNCIIKELKPKERDIVMTNYNYYD